MYRNHNNAFKNNNNRKYNRNYNNKNNYNQNNYNKKESINVNPDFPKEYINNYKKIYNLHITHSNHILDVCGYQKDINNFKNNIDQYIRKLYNNNLNNFPESFTNNKTDQKWGNKDPQELNKELENAKIIKLINEKKEKEKDVLFDTNNIVPVILPNTKLYKKFQNNDDSIYSVLSNMYLEEENDKSFLTEQEREESFYTDEDQYNDVSYRYNINSSSSEEDLYEEHFD